MVDTEIWLRLMSISSLYGDDMVRIAHWVAKQSHIDAVVLQQTGLTLRQAQRFLSFPRKSIESSLCWLEQPNHHLIPADSEFYPPQRPRRCRTHLPAPPARCGRGRAG